MENNSAFDLIRKSDRMTLGLELLLDNDWSPAGESRRAAAGRPRGVPDLSSQADLIRQADDLGFSAVGMRDVPVFDQVNMGDAGSVHDVFTLLGFLASITRNMALGTAAVVLPIGHLLMTAKAASVDAPSGGRLILGVASGDRPVEYPLLGLDFEVRGEAFRDAITYPRAAWRLVAEPRARQDDDWAGLERPLRLSGQRRQAGGAGGRLGQRDGRAWRFFSAFHFDLLADIDAPAEPIRFGARAGRKALTSRFQALAMAGVDHIAINLRQSARPLAEVIEELASDVMPMLDKKPAALAA